MIYGFEPFAGPMHLGPKTVPLSYLEGSVECMQRIMGSEVCFSLKEFYLYLKMDDFKIPTAFGSPASWRTT